MSRVWNQQSYGKQVGAPVDQQTVLRQGLAYGALALGCSWLIRSPLLLWLRLPHFKLIELLLLLVATLSSLALVSVLARWRDGQRLLKAQAMLGAQQRALLGLPPAAAKAPDATLPAAAPAPRPLAAVLATPRTPGTRAPPLMPASGGRLLGDGATPQSLLASASTTRSGISRASPSARTPYSGGKAVATPEQLRTYLDQWQPAAADAAGAAATPGAAYEAVAAAASSYPGSSGYDGAGYYEGTGGVDGVGGSPALPLGRDAPTYRLSVLPRKGTAAATAGSGSAGEALQPSGAAEAAAVIRDMLAAAPQEEAEEHEATTGGARSAAAPDLMLWSERFREWMSAQVLQPLVGLLDGTHLEANRLLRAAGETQTQLPPLLGAVGLPAEDAASSDGVSHLWAMFGAAGTAGSSGPAAGSGGVDPEATVRHLLARCAGLAPAQRGAIAPLVKALNTYGALLALLRGKRPQDLLPPAPPSYVAARIKQLAKGTCMAAFTWNGGGSHQGQPWTAGELPTDSALVLYLFAAFLDAPGWQFGAHTMGSSGADAGSMLGGGGNGTAGTARGAPLFLGALRARPPSVYSALLAFRPDRPGPGAAAVIGSALSTAEPRFTLLVQGQLLTLAERDGVFQALLLWLAYHARARGGLVGGVYLSDDALRGLDAVLSPGGVGATIRQRIWALFMEPQRAFAR